MRSLKAYHQVLGPGALDTILNEGVILPASYRLDVAWLKKRCGAFMISLKEKNPKGDPLGFKAVDDALDSAINDIEAAQHKASVVGTQKKTALECQDIIFGDADKIFLSIGKFALKGAKTGLVFDARDLVERGAFVRGCDYYQAYDGVIESALYGSEEYPSTYDGFDIFESEYESIRDRLVSDVEYLKDATEILWEGPLPLDLAIEVIRNGHVSRLK